MSLIMYLTKAPRYEGINVKDIKLIESYLEWQHEIEIGSRYASKTFEKWCGSSESELPKKDIVNFYKQFWTEKNVVVEGAGVIEKPSLFENVARLVKMNQIFNWFIKNIMDNKIDHEYYEVSKENLEKLLAVCNKVKMNGIKFVNKDEHYRNTYEVDDEIASTYLPLLKNKGYFFGPEDYDTIYAKQVIDTAQIINKILATTDFEKEVIYFNAIW